MYHFVIFVINWVINDSKFIDLLFNPVCKDVHVYIMRFIV